MVEIPGLVGEFVHARQRPHALSNSPRARAVPAEQDAARDVDLKSPVGGLHPLDVELGDVVRTDLRSVRDGYEGRRWRRLLRALCFATPDALREFRSGKRTAGVSARQILRWRTLRLQERHPAYDQTDEEKPGNHRGEERAYRRFERDAT